MAIFDDQTQALVISSVKRAKFLTEQSRIGFSTELIDTYNGFGNDYFDSFVEKTFKSSQAKENIKSLAMCYPLLKKFINSISMVYESMPQRKFYQDGKEIVKKVPEGSVKEKYVENEKLYNVLNNNFYNLENQLRIKEMEKLTNLLNTTVHKVNYRQDKLMIDFIPNDLTQVTQNKDDVTSVKKVIFMQNALTNSSTTTPQVTYEVWDKESFRIVNGLSSIGKTGDEMENGAASEAEKLFGYRDIGSAFPPFAVSRSSLATDDFWNIKDIDILKIIKQLNVKIAEFSYLIRYASFGMKYSVNIKMPQNGTIDPAGFLELYTDSPDREAGKNWEFGELANNSKLTEVKEAILGLIKLLYDQYGIASENLVSSAQKSSGESKSVDKESLQAIINYQRDIWRMNEETLFKVMCSVWNRNSQNSIPKGVTLTVDYKDTINEDKARAEYENWMALISSNIKNHLDWIMSLNPDLTTEEAKVLYEKNKEINDGVSSKGIETDMNTDGEQTPPVDPENNLDNNTPAPQGE